MKRILKFLFANLDTVIAIVVSIFAAIFGVFGGNQVVLLAGIATTLGIIAYGIIRDRINRENLAEHIVSLEKLLTEMTSGKIKSDSFFVKRTKLTPLPYDMKRAKSTLDMAGTSLLSVGVTYQATLRELKESGIKIRLLVSNPDNKNLQEHLSKRYLEAETAVVHANQVRASLTSLAPLISSNKRGGTVQVRITDHVQTFSYIGCDANKPNGYIQVEFYLNKIGLERDPIFILEAGKDVHWFSEFNKQFEFLWNSATEVDPKKYL
jgi:hypothetical protein